MKPAALRPSVHLFVCANARPKGDPLGPGCGARGDAVYARLKAEVAARAAHRSTWVTRTFCLGLCPPRGTSVARYPDGALFVEVHEEDVPRLLSKEDEA